MIAKPGIAFEDATGEGVRTTAALPAKPSEATNGASRRELDALERASTFRISRRDLPDKAKLRPVRLFSNIRIYEWVGGLYDATLGFWSREVRARAADVLDLGEGERLLIVGVGTGMELEHLPAWTRGAGVDLSAGMLRRARRRRADLGMRGLDLRVMDARTLDFPDECFEAAYLPLILTVVEDGARVLAEAARVTAPGGRLVIADRFWPEGRPRPAAARAASWALGHVAMRFDIRLSEILAGAPSLEVERHVRVAPGAFFHLVTLRKPDSRKPG